MSFCHQGHEKVSPSSGYLQEGVVPFVVDAVYTMAHAMTNMMADICPNPEVACDIMNPPDGAQLLTYIRNISFVG